MKVLVTGSNGQLGSELNKISSNYNFNWFFTNKESFDLSVLNNIYSFLDINKPQIIINCAAYTSVESSESNFKYANDVNHKAIKLIAKWSSNNNCKLIHISSDYVFDGTSNTPLKEDSLNLPINNYGKTKSLGDISCLNNNPSSIIIRTAWLYSSFGNNFVKNIITLMKKNKKIEVINDQIGCPTYAADLAITIMNIINHKNWIPGIYNYTNFGNISWFEFSKNIKYLFGFTTIISPILSKDYYMTIQRPKYSVLDNSKIINTFGIEQIDYKISLKKCIKILKNES